MKKENREVEAAIRELRVDDYDAVVALWEEVGLPYKPRGRDGREALAAQLADATAIYLVAERAGEIVGAVLGSHDGRKGWINRLAVATPYHRRGLGARLVAEVERRLAALGIEIFACLVEGWNDDSKAFFERLGYKPFDDMTYYTKRRNRDV